MAQGKTRTDVGKSPRRRTSASSRVCATGQGNGKRQFECQSHLQASRDALSDPKPRWDMKERLKNLQNGLVV
ncbi:hypothetical protein THARTR1_05158 [Trichoderma harzianum]|uniref:Uncharacterized protein n=1 Tax=Trichoderma harzianum TaxID=5544 RepID=A0A2K0U9Z8_TRIHA|nr:hypothetical protein THARTR1_05158 [Trichoderma harzianum]